MCCIGWEKGAYLEEVRKNENDCRRWETLNRYSIQRQELSLARGKQLSTIQEGRLAVDIDMFYNVEFGFLLY